MSPKAYVKFPFSINKTEVVVLSVEDEKALVSRADGKTIKGDQQVWVPINKIEVRA